MAKTEKFTKDIIITKTIEFIEKEGYENFTVRNLANFIGCSTQPLFRQYKNSEDIKKDIIRYLSEEYDKYKERIIKENDYLLTSSYALVLFSLEKNNFYNMLFLNKKEEKKSLESSWNRDIIDNIVRQYNLKMNEAEELYRDVEIYTYGLAYQLSINKIDIDKEELYDLINNMINTLIKNIKEK